MEKSLQKEFEGHLGYTFKNSSLLVEAVTHTSQTADRLKSNERLEFFGDAILDLVICQDLFERFPEYQEGDLTKIKSMLVSRKTCAKIAKKIDLVKYLKIGKGMEDSRGLLGSVVAGAFEAIVAAIYLDGGIEAARDFILRLFNPLIEKTDAEQHQENYKSLLQQYAQQNMEASPVYEVVDEQGPDHNKCFESEVAIGGRRFKSAWGVNKKTSEQKAAKNALIELGVIEQDEDE